MRWAGHEVRMEEGSSTFKILTSKIELKKKLVRCYVWSIALYGAESWSLRKLERKYLESFEMWCWRRIEKIEWSEKVTNEQVYDRKERDL